MSHERFGQAVRARREMLGFSQTDLARTLGISRQNLVEIEAGRRLPQLPLARRLAHLLGWTLDELARDLPVGVAEPVLEWVLSTPPAAETPAVWSRIGRRIVVASAGGLSPAFALDGVYDPKTGRLRNGAGTSDPGSTVFIGGCDPFLPWLYGATPHPDLTLYVFPMGSTSALAALAAGHILLAGSHLFDPESGRYNAAVERLPFPVRRLRYVYWEEGLMGDLAHPRGLALRESGSEARALFERNRHRIPLGDPGVVELDSHWAIARYVRAHPETAGIGLRATAEAMGLPFSPWADEPYEWVTRAEWGSDPRIAAFQEWLGSPAVKRAMAQIPGLTPWEPGRAIPPADGSD